MCNIKDGFKLCTCSTIDEDEADWVLHRINPIKPNIVAVGLWMEPELVPDLQLNHQVLQNLNKRNCFDFEYTAQQNDYLEICVDKEKNTWLYYRFNNGTWEEDEGYPFSDWKNELDEFKHGKIGHE